jgi:hypothetical protein
MTSLSTITDFEYQLQEIRRGLGEILRHFEGEPLWPRTVSKRVGREHPQTLVNNEREAIRFFDDGNLLDYRINAYPQYTDSYINRTGIAPTQLMIDHDLEHFGTMEELELAVAKTLSNIKKICPQTEPTLMWTGNGYHTILTQSVEVLEKVKKLAEFYEPSRKFLQFQEQYLSDGKADPCHSNNVSFKNCMLRIPGSLNSSQLIYDNRECKIPPKAWVRIVEPWNGNKFDVQPLYIPYYIWLQAGAIKDVQKRIQQQSRPGGSPSGSGPRRIGWIERLLNKPLDDYRKFCIWRVLCPYLINVKVLSREFAFRSISSWLDRCNSLRRLDFSPRQKVNYELDHVGPYFPISRSDLERKNTPLFSRLRIEGVI